MGRTKIDWCDWVWNPVHGCHFDCPYCYANKMAQRRHDIFKDFHNVHFATRNFIKPFPSKPSLIFVNSMSDVFFWTPEWWDAVRTRLDQDASRKHLFVFLTKGDPLRAYPDQMPSNCIRGVTVTHAVGMFLVDRVLSEELINIEPMHGPIDPMKINPKRWLIIGAETGNRRGKILPEPKWIANLVDYFRGRVPIWMKDNLEEIWKKKLIQERPFP